MEREGEEREKEKKRGGRETETERGEGERERRGCILPGSCSFFQMVDDCLLNSTNLFVARIESAAL